MWKLVKTIVKNMFIYPCGWARTMSRVVVHLQIYVHCLCQLAQHPITIIDQPPTWIASHNDNDNDNNSSSWLETRHVSRYKQQQWWRLPCSRLQRLRKANYDDWRTGVEMRKETECQWNTVSSSQKCNDFLEKCSRFTCCTVISERKKLGVITTI